MSSARAHQGRALRAVLLAAVLALAALLRFTGLGWGLRHPPHMDERVFVENVFAMMAAGDLDHRYYEYPGLVFYLLWPLLRPLADSPGPTAYLLARGLIAASGVLGCALLYPLGRRLHSPAAGLTAALLMAVSPVAVETAHMVRPDVLLQALAAAVLLAGARLDGSRRREAVAGATLGLALATKFSGVFLLPGYLVARLLAPGPRWRRLALGLAAAGAVFAACSPYALLHLPEFVEGVQVQLRYHYEEPVREPASYGSMVRGYGEVWLRALGLLATALSVLGLEAALRRARLWLPPLLLVAVSVGVLATSDVRHDRFLLPALGTACLLAGAAVARVGQLVRGRAGVAAMSALAALAAVGPGRSSLEYALLMRGPLTRDLVLDWAATHIPSGARVVSTVPLLGLDASRLDVIALERLGPEARAQVLEADFVLSVDGDHPAALEGLERLSVLTPATKYQGRTSVMAWRVPWTLRPPYQPLELQPAWLSASDRPQELGALCDGRAEPLWTTEGPQEQGDWVQVMLPEPARVGRIELLLGTQRRFAARRLRLEVSPDGVRWDVQPVSSGRPPVEAQLPTREHSQVLLISTPRPVRGLRLVQTGLGWRRRWGIAELRLWHLPAPASPPAPFAGGRHP